jgi:hypothetical protein
MVMSAVCESRSRPSCFHLHLAVRRFMLVRSPAHKPLVLTGTVVDACASLQLLFCFPLFNCQGATGSKSCSLLCRLLETDEPRNNSTS